VGLLVSEILDPARLYIDVVKEDEAPSPVKQLALKRLNAVFILYLPLNLLLLLLLLTPG